MDLPKRKHPRLKTYDYSAPGYYYITIHLSKDGPRLSAVGRGLDPADVSIKLTAAGRIAQEQLQKLSTRFHFLRLDKYVIMPTHIHAILVFDADTAGASPRPTLTDVVGAYKSLTTRTYNRIFKTPGQKMFQTSFYETVLRSEEAYRQCWRYIDENPLKWYLEPEDR